MAPDESTHTHRHTRTLLCPAPKTPPKKNKKNNPPPQNTKVTDTIQAAQTLTDPEAPRILHRGKGQKQQEKQEKVRKT